MLLLAAHPAYAESAYWYGTWHLDRARSHLTGTTIRIARTHKGYHFDFGAIKFDIGDDGAFYPTVPGRSTSLTPIGDRTWLRIHRDQGKDVDRSILRISPDQSVLTIETEALSPAGVVHRARDVVHRARDVVHRARDIERRIGDGVGLAGAWRSTQAGINVPETLTVKALPGGRIRWGSAEEGNYFDVTPNGPPAPNRGPRAVPDVTLALRAPSPTELRWTESIAGKPIMEGADSLDGDGTLTETSWPDQSPADRQEAVYLRQHTTPPP